MATVTAPAETHRPADGRTVPYRFTVDQYHRMIDAGVFGDIRCELLEGLVVKKVTQNPPHGSAVTRLYRRLARLLSEAWTLRAQCPISVPGSEPEPDIAVARGPEERYDARHPAARDVTLVVEVADSSLDQDRGEKQRIYAAARIPVYWIVNLVEGQIEVYTLPRAGRSPAYRNRQDFRPGEQVPVVLAGKEVCRLRVRELLP
jgi:Uma2 family endonuclease